MNNIYILNYSPTLIRKAVFRFWWRVTGWRFIAVLFLVAASFLSLLLKGERSWAVGALGVVLAFGLIFISALYVIHVKHAIRKFNAMGTPSAELSFSKESFTLTSGLGTTTLQWSAVSELWQFPDVWLMLFSRAQFITLPLDSISQEAKAAMLKNIELAGGMLR